MEGVLKKRRRFKLAEEDLVSCCKPVRGSSKSMGIFDGCLDVCRRAGLSRESDITVLVVGDGLRPRTAGLLAMLTHWKIVSIDPRLHAVRAGPVQKVRARIEDLDLCFDTPVIICAPHSHAMLSDCLAAVSAPARHVVSLPCCVADDIGAPTLSYEDPRVLSPKNRVNVYMDK